MIYGTKVVLRTLQQENATKLTSFLSDMSVTRFVSRTKPITVSQEEEWIEKVNNSDTDIVFAIYIVVDNYEVFVGCCGFAQY